MKMKNKHLDKKLLVIMMIHILFVFYLGLSLQMYWFIKHYCVIIVTGYHENEDFGYKVVDEENNDFHMISTSKIIRRNGTQFSSSDEWEKELNCECPGVYPGVYSNPEDFQYELNITNNLECKCSILPIEVGK